MNQTLASNYRSEGFAVGAGDTRCCFKHREKRFFVCVCVCTFKLFETTGLVCLYGILPTTTQRETPLCTSGLSDNTSIDVDIDVCANFSAPYTNL